MWRPLNYVITDSPLALCDARTVSVDDVIAVDQVTPSYVFDLYQLKHSDRQQWYWMSEQTPQEMAIFVQFDSEAVNDSNILGGKITVFEALENAIADQIIACPHASFHNSNAPDDSPPRESVEVRLIIFNKLELAL